MNNIVEALVNGDEKTRQSAWKDFASQYERLVCFIARSANYENPHDLMTELYLHLSGASGTWNRLKSYQAKSGIGFEKWLAVVASRLAYSNAKQQTEITTDNLDGIKDEADVSPVATVLKTFERAVLMRAVEKLKHAECRVIIRRHHWDGMNLRTIADELNLSHDNVRQIHHRNLSELKRKLASAL